MTTELGNRGSKAVGSRNSTGRRFKLALLLVGTAALMGPALPATGFASETTSGAAITVLVFNFRQAPAETLVKAEKEAGRILEQGGVPVTWRDCPTGNEPCRKGPGRVFFLAMMAGPVQNKFLDTISGYALLPAHLATVYYDYLPRMPGGKGNQNDTALVLGCVIAHELGHLLLGAHGHSFGGIMQAHWGIEQTQRALMSQLSFLPEESRLMQADTAAPKAKNNSSSALTSQ
ncbi:MAG: hypothetical protein ACRD23_05205 [Terriglobales bacterium]